MDDEQYAAYTFVPSDPELALALDSAAKMAREADNKFCAAFGGDGETSAFWLTAAVSEIRAALSRQALRAPAPSEAVAERIVRHPNGHLMVERVPAWVPTEEQTSEALKSLGKAWPYLADHAPHIDGEFNIAHRNLTRYVERFRELLATHPAPARGVTEEQAADVLFWMASAARNGKPLAPILTAALTPDAP